MKTCVKDLRSSKRRPDLRADARPTWPEAPDSFWLLRLVRRRERGAGGGTRASCPDGVLFCHDFESYVGVDSALSSAAFCVFPVKRWRRAICSDGSDGGVRGLSTRIRGFG